MSEGTEALNVMGNGKVTIPAYSDTIRAKLDRVQPGDICVCWTTAPLLTAARALHVATFIVETRQYNNGRYEISGPGLLGELDEYIAIAPVGQSSEVVTTARSLGTRVVNHPPPVDDTYETLAAAYPPRYYTTQDVNPAGRVNVLFLQATTCQETDTFTAYFPGGLVFTTDIVWVSPRMFEVKLNEPLPQSLPAGSTCYIHSKRLRVTDASLFVEGSALFYTAIDTFVPVGTQGNIIIDRIDDGGGPNDTGYVYATDPIIHTIAAGSGVTQFQYTAPTTGDVELLLRNSTFNEWSLLRSVYATMGTAYAPDSETVWDVLTAITDMSDYKVRRYFRGFASGEQNSSAKDALYPRRRLEYFPVGQPIVPGEVTTLGPDTKLATDYGTVLSMETEDANSPLSHLIPYGGGSGSGRFDFRTAPIGTILADYPTIGWGIVNNHYYIYDKTTTSHASWATETFAHISPLDPTSYLSRREAAEMLLRAACDWLIARKVTDTTYSVEVFTIGEPRVGDVVSLTFSGADPTTVTAPSLVISEMTHSVNDESGLRMTRMTLNKTGAPTTSGAKTAALALRNLQRGFRKANIGSRGDARIDYDSVGFGGDGTVQSQTGDMTIQSARGDVFIVSETGKITMAGREVNISAPVSTSGTIRTSDGVVMPDEARNYDWQLTIVTVNGKPRLKANYRARPQ